MSEIKDTIYDICNPGIDGFHDEDYLEPAEIFFLDKNLEKNEDEFLNLIKFYINKESCSGIFLLEVLGDLNYFPVINILSNVLDDLTNKLNLYANKDEKQYINLISKGMNIVICLVRLNSSKGFPFVKHFWNDLDQWHQNSHFMDLFNVNNKLAIELIFEFLERDKIVDKSYLDKTDHYLFVLEKNKKINSLIKFSIEIQLKRHDFKEKNKFFEQLKSFLRKNQIKVVFRSLEDDIGGFIDRRTRINFDLFTNQNISAKEIAKLFGNNSILYLSGNAQIDKKNIFYENAAWYRESKNMSERDKVFWNDSSIVKFRVYNVVHGL